MLLWLARLWLNPRLQLLWPPVCWLAVIFAVYAIARYATADIEYVARLEMVRVVIYTFLFLAILNNLYRQEFTQTIVLTMVFLGMGISFYALYQFITDSDKVWTFTKPYAHRATGTYISPNNLAGFLEMILPLGLTWTLVSRARPVIKVLTGYASFVIAAGIAVTLSRGGWAGAVLALLSLFVVLFLQRTYRLPSAVMFIVMVAGGLYLIPRSHFFEDRLNQITANDRLNDSARFDLWGPAVQLWQQNPWWGIGPDHFNYRFRAVRPEVVQLEPDRVHNDYLNTLTDWGIVGTAIVLSAWSLFWVGVFRTWPLLKGPANDLAAKKSNKLALLLGGSLGLVAILAHSLVDFNMHIPANAILCITLMALVSGCWRFATDRFWVTARGAVKIPLTIILVTGTVALGWQGTRRAKEYVWLTRADAASNFSTEQISALEKAFEVEPQNFETAYELGEAFRVQSWDGNDDYARLAAHGIEWFERAAKLNPYHSSSFMRKGMCLDWLGRPTEAFTQFNRAVHLDPNGYFTTAHMGWHYVQVEDYAAARVWFERSLRLQTKDNPVADSYLRIVNERLLNAATQTSSLSPVAR
jgi:O-antigen ligase